MNIRILLVTHGQLGAEFISTVSDIMGRGEEIDFFGINRSMPIDEIKTGIGELLNSMPVDSNVLIMTDIPGGTPTNIVVPFLEKDGVEVVTGLNLPMLITALHRRTSVKDISQLVDIVSSAAGKGILNCRQKLNG